jgi:hypothetical protein
VGEEFEPGRPAVEAVFLAWVATTLGGVALVQGLARVLPPAAASDSAPAGVPLTLAIVFVALSFAVAQAVLPGPKSCGFAGLALPMAGAISLAARGLEPAAVVASLFSGVFLTPAAYYMAIRFSFALGGSLRRRPVRALVAFAAGVAAVVLVVRWLTWSARGLH